MTETTPPSKAFPPSALGTGLLGIALVLGLAALIIAPFSHHTFTDWVATAFMAATPTQVILGLLWRNSRPARVAALPQPAKGFGLLAITVLAGAFVFGAFLLLLSGGHGMTPMLIQYAILTVVVVLWWVPVWECWPWSRISPNPAVFGLATLVASYVLAWILWRVFFNYGALAQVGHPHYHAALDPGGLFDMWTAMTFAVTAVGVIIVHMLFDFWPINKIAGAAEQPARGFIATIYVFALSFVIRWIFVHGLGMDAVNYMVQVPVSMIFGTFLVNNMMQFQLFTNLPQPKRGLALLGCAVLTAMLMYRLYVFAATLHTGSPLGSGPEAGFALELWVASAMLGVTFPLIFLVSGFFDFWPIKRK